eukprot:7610001-Alexandrium_andersonii.AAC.1
MAELAPRPLAAWAEEGEVDVGQGAGDGQRVDCRHLLARRLGLLGRVTPVARAVPLEHLARA